MERARPNSIIIVLISALAAVAIICLCFFTGGAWLTDTGAWMDGYGEQFTLGRMVYFFSINGEDIDLTKENRAKLAVPIVGGVKLNESELLDASDPLYQKYAEENFNEGVTIATVVITNDSDFDIKMRIEMDLSGIIGTSTDIFCLALPQAAIIDHAAHTVTVANTAYSYKDYVKQAFSYPDFYAPMTFAQMKEKESEYYNNFSFAPTDEAGYAFERTFAKRGGKVEVNLLFFSEYSGLLPFVTSSPEQLVQPDGLVNSLSTQFIFKLTMVQSSEDPV